MAIEPQNNNLNYLIDPTFTNVNKLLFCRSQEVMQVITETPFQTILPGLSKYCDSGFVAIN